MSLLINYPEAIVVSILCEWCTIGDWLILDSAFCSKVDRTSVLNIFRHPGFSLEYCNGSSNLYWMSIREVKSNFVFLLALDLYLLKFVPILTSAIRSIEFFEITPIFPNIFDTMLRFINLCTNLRSIGLINSEMPSDLFVKIDPRICHQLTYLCFDDMVILSQTDVLHIANHCRELKTLLIHRMAVAGTENHFLEIIKQNPGLELCKLNFNSNLIVLGGDIINAESADQICVQLVRYCPNIASIELFSAYPASDHVVLSVIKNCQCLKSFYLGAHSSRLYFYFQYFVLADIVYMTIYSDDSILKCDFYDLCLREVGDSIGCLTIQYAQKFKHLLESASVYCHVSLKILHLHYVDNNDESINTIKSVIKYCQRLEQLALYDTNWSTTDLLNVFSVKYSFTSLTMYRIGEMSFLDAIVIFEANPSLKKYCILSTHISEEEIEKLETIVNNRSHI
jgi:hypothetical protein